MKPSTSCLAGRSGLFGIGLAVALVLMPWPQALARGQGAAPMEAEGLSASFRKAARKVLPAVVTVRPDNPGGASPLGGPTRPDFVPGPPPPASGGSGLIVDAEKGYVLTNDHLVGGLSRVMVTLHDGRERPVSEVRRDPRSDLALLVIDAKGLTGADWGDAEALDTGDWVLAVGQPFGLSGTVTAGIVSGKGRGVGIARYEDLIQTDAAINPGNSGGPLVNLKGQVVGINTALKTVRGGFEGVGFAVPSSRARRVAADLARHGRVRRAFLGVTIGPVDPATAERLEQPGAVAVNGVAGGSPADKAGLKPGDLLISLKGQPVRGLGALQAAIEFARAGEPLALTIDRGGQRREVEVRPEAQPDRPEQGQGVFPGAPVEGIARLQETVRRGLDRNGADRDFGELGLRLSETGPQPVGQPRPRDGDRGLLVVGVVPEGPADRSGVEIGMRITDAAGRPVATLGDFQKAIAARPKDRGLLLRVLRGTKREFRVIVDPAVLEKDKDKDGAPPPDPRPEDARDR